METSQDRIIFQEHLSSVSKLVSLSIYTGTQTRHISSTSPTLSRCDSRVLRADLSASEERVRSVSCLSASRMVVFLELISTYFQVIVGIFCYFRCRSRVRRYRFADSYRKFRPPGKCVRRNCICKSDAVFYCPWPGTMMDGVRRQRSANKCSLSCEYMYGGEAVYLVSGCRGLAGVKMIIRGVYYRLSLLVSIC